MQIESECVPPATCIRIFNRGPLTDDEVEGGNEDGVGIMVGQWFGARCWRVLLASFVYLTMMVVVTLNTVMVMMTVMVVTITAVMRVAVMRRKVDMRADVVSGGVVTPVRVAECGYEGC